MSINEKSKMSFLNVIKRHFEDWQKDNKCSEAVNLNRSIGQSYFDEAQPNFFFGDLDATFVLVHLNPKRGIKDYNQKSGFRNFNDYVSFYSNFGKNNYGINSPRTHKSHFDHKNIRFIKPFRILPFVENNKYQNLEVVCDKKLQIELIPYGSPDFDYKTIGVKNINPFIERILDLIISKERSKIIFCGKIFIDVLSEFITQKREFTFKLTKSNGEKTRDDFELINIKIKFKGTEIVAAIAPQFAKQGYPVAEYGEQINSQYNLF
jgi:hypothetical protein